MEECITKVNNEVDEVTKGEESGSVWKRPFEQSLNESQACRGDDESGELLRENTCRLIL